jgi:LAO/AO transport system kinase
MPPELLDGLLARDRGAVSQALNLLDDRRPEQRAAARALLDALESGAHCNGRRIGVTGAPGAGKSTLLDALVRDLRGRGQTIGILAVDPSSQRSGGALLGDRLRMRSSSRDDGVFVRSMAARERLGGLADVTYASALVLSAVYDTVFVETVGIGQSEADIAGLADTLIFVVQPGAGDMLQFMKAGILELPDLFVVNKADIGAVAERTASELEAGLGLGERRHDEWQPPVLLVSARDGDGIAALVDSLAAHDLVIDANGERSARRARARIRFISHALTSRYGSYGIDAGGGREALEARVREAPGRTTFALLDELGSEIERALAAPGRDDGNR